MRAGAAVPVPGRGEGGAERVVPLTVRAVTGDDAVFQVLHPLIADLDPAGVVALIEDGGDLQALVGGGGGDAGHGILPRHQRPGAPGAGDVAEQPVLDLVPLARPGREVAHRDLQPGLFGQDGELVFPEPAPVAVGAAGVAGGQQPPRARVAGAALGPPPQPQRVHRERCGVMADPDGHEPPVRGDVVDPVRGDLPQLLIGEVVVADPNRVPGGPPRSPVPVIGAELLLLLGVHADRRVARRPERSDLLVDVPELGIPVRVLPALQHLRHPLQAVAVLAQHPRHRVLLAPEPQPGHLMLQVPQRQRAPGDLRHGVAPRGRLRQPPQRRS